MSERDVLVGADHYWDLVTGDIVKGEYGPTAINSRLVWLISGPAESPSSPDKSTTSSLILTQNDPHFSIPSTNDSKLADSLDDSGRRSQLGYSSSSLTTIEKKEFSVTYDIPLSDMKSASLGRMIDQQ